MGSGSLRERDGSGSADSFGSKTHGSGSGMRNCRQFADSCALMKSAAGIRIVGPRVPNRDRIAAMAAEAPKCAG